MEIIKGIPVSPGIAIREAFLLDSEDLLIPQRSIKKDLSGEEVAKLMRAVEQAKEDIKKLQEKVSHDIGNTYSTIFDTHQALLSDKALLDEVIARIKEDNFTAEYSLSRVLRKYIKAFRKIENEYLAQRVTDIYDLEKRLLRKLIGEKRQGLSSIQSEVILVTHDLTPSQTAALDRSKIAGFATDVGGRTSHTAIMARALEIPAVVGLRTITTDISGGDTLVVDGNRGIVIINPDETTLEKYRAMAKDFAIFEKGLVKERHLPAQTLDKHRITILANIEFPEEIPSALSHGAEGVGLYRTEYLYLKSPEPPSEDDHFHAYKKAAELLGKRPLYVRTLDLGADKAPENFAPEKNPLLGCRSIRLCMESPEIFKTQIRALLRASVFGDIRVFFPMITTVDEVKWGREVIENVKDELSEQKIPFNKDMKVGIMVETPAAVISADLLAPHVDFFSIGTNDLVQYTFAIDRTNERVASLYLPLHPVILRMLRTVMDAGKKHNISVSMCGEMSSEAAFIVLLVGMGLSEISVTPASVPELKRVIRSFHMADCRRVAKKALSLNDPVKTSEYLRQTVEAIYPESISVNEMM